MNKDTSFLDSLAEAFSHLPGVGKKTAERYAYYVLDKMKLEDVQKFSECMLESKKNITHCNECGMLCLQKTCFICSNNLRDHSKIMVVKDTKDALAIDATNQYDGVFHILGGLISPMDGISPEDLNVHSLEERSKNNIVKEIILALPFTPIGEINTMYLEKILKREGLIISKIGYGLPAGSDIEYVDELTLKQAITTRKVED